jgi:hypothetical protein
MDNGVKRLAKYLGSPPSPPEAYEIGVAFQTSMILVAWVPKYRCVFEILPGSTIYLADDKTKELTKAQKCSGSTEDWEEVAQEDPFDLELLKRFIRQCHMRSERLKAADYNNMGYAYACLPEPDLKKAERAFRDALQKARMAKDEGMQVISANMDKLAKLKLRRPEGPVSPIPQDYLRELISAINYNIREGKEPDIRLMTRDEIVSLEMM